MILCFRFHVCKDTERESIEMEMKFIKYTVCWRMKIVRWKWAGPLGFRIYWSGLAWALGGICRSMFYTMKIYERHFG